MVATVVTNTHRNEFFIISLRKRRTFAHPIRDREKSSSNFMRNYQFWGSRDQKMVTNSPSESMYRRCVDSYPKPIQTASLLLCFVLLSFIINAIVVGIIVVKNVGLSSYRVLAEACQPFCRRSYLFIFHVHFTNIIQENSRLDQTNLKYCFIFIPSRLCKSVSDTFELPESLRTMTLIWPKEMPNILIFMSSKGGYLCQECSLIVDNFKRISWTYMYEDFLDLYLFQNGGPLFHNSSCSCQSWSH